MFYSYLQKRSKKEESKERREGRREEERKERRDGDRKGRKKGERKREMTESNFSYSKMVVAMPMIRTPDYSVSLTVGRRCANTSVHLYILLSILSNKSLILIKLSFLCVCHPSA